MEQEETTVDPQYLKGFNNGYQLAKHEPELAAQLTAQPNDHNVYFKGLFSGKQQYENDMREWAKSFSKGNPVKDDRDVHKER
jgi:hypothetical protein